jgi:hypothetical protein
MSAESSVDPHDRPDIFPTISVALTYGALLYWLAQSLLPHVDLTNQIMLDRCRHA